MCVVCWCCDAAGAVLVCVCVCVQVKPGTPVLMCSVPGYDASGLVRDLAAEQNKHITSISIGTYTSLVGKLLFQLTSKAMHYFQI